MRSNHAVATHQVLIIVVKNADFAAFTNGAMNYASGISGSTNLVSFSKDSCQPK